MRVLYLTGIIVVLDQVTKLLIKGFSMPFLNIYHSGMQLGASIPIMGEFFRLTFIENPGMAFGIDVGGKLFLTLFSLAASIGILWYVWKVREESLAIRIPLALILGGAIGNLIDRVFYGVIFGEGPLFHGKVVDFLDVDFFNIDFFGYHIHRWPVFNIADASVSVGVFLLLIFHRKFKSLEEQQALAAATPVADSQGVNDGPAIRSTDQQSSP
ncbi:MAG TPA: signal peptidase II [Bacteroidota bacterium]|nr:signal peptidase II [Bacteroidota bacterium]